MKVSKDKRHLFSQNPPRKLAKDRIQVAKRWGKLMAKDHVIRMECARLSFTETWWCIVIHLFSRYSPRKLAKATLLWLLLAKAKTQVAKGSRKIMAKDHVILTKSKRVFDTALNRLSSLRDGFGRRNQTSRRENTATKQASLPNPDISAMKMIVELCFETWNKNMMNHFEVTYKNVTRHIHHFQFFFAIFCFQHDSWGATLPWPQRKSRCRSWTEYCGIQTFGSSGRFGVGDLDFGTDPWDTWSWEFLALECFPANPGKGLKVKRFISSLSVIFLKNDVGRRHATSHKSQVFQLNPSSWGTGISWFPLFRINEGIKIKSQLTHGFVLQLFPLDAVLGSAEKRRGGFFGHWKEGLT